jgi:hypothetical protein
MVEKALIDCSYDIDEEIIKEDAGFVHKIMSGNEDVVDRIIKASKKLEKELKDADLTTADEKLRPLLEIFAKNKGKITYSFDTFDNGVIRIFETEDENIVSQLHDAAESLQTTEEERAKAEAASLEKSSVVEEEAAELEEWDPDKVDVEESDSEDISEEDK